MHDTGSTCGAQIQIGKAGSFVVHMPDPSGADFGASSAAIAKVPMVSKFAVSVEKLSPDSAGQSHVADGSHAEPC